MDAWERMVAREASDLLPHLIESFEQGAFMTEQQWTLADIEASLQARIDYLSKTDLGEVPYSDYTECYTALTQVKQAQTLEQIAHTLKSLDDNSIVTQRP